MWYKIIMWTFVPLLAIAWTVYYFYNKRLDEMEQAERETKGSTGVQKQQSEVEQWAEKMADFKPPKRPYQDENDAS